MERTFDELEELITNATKKVNIQKVSNFDSAFIKFKTELSGIENIDVLISNSSDNVIIVTYYNEDIAHIAGNFLLHPPRYYLHEENILFFYDV